MQINIDTTYNISFDVEILTIYVNQSCPITTLMFKASYSSIVIQWIISYFFIICNSFPW